MRKKNEKKFITRKINDGVGKKKKKKRKKDECRDWGKNKKKVHTTEKEGAVIRCDDYTVEVQMIPSSNILFFSFFAFFFVQDCER